MNKYKGLLAVFAVILLIIGGLGASTLGTHAFSTNESLGDIFVPYTTEDYASEFTDYASTKVTYGARSGSKTNAVGTIIDKDTNVPLAGVLVTVNGLTLITDSNGRFQIKGLPDGYYNYTIRYNEYSDAEYLNYPVFEANGADIYLFAISKTEEISKDYYARFDRRETCSSCNYTETNLRSTRTISLANEFSVRKTDGTIIHPRRDIYLNYVLSNELYAPSVYQAEGMTDNQILELFRAQSVVSRTFLESSIVNYSPHRAEGYTVCSTTCCQVFTTDYLHFVAMQAVNDTETSTTAEIVTYNGRVATTLFFSSCSGSTKDNEDVNGYAYDYLVSVPCPRSNHLGGENGGQGVGMCQAGAAGRAKDGETYEEIIEYYYTGATVTTANQVYEDE